MVCFPYAFFDKSIASRDDIYKVISVQSYKDMTPRHLKGIGKYKNEKVGIFNYITDQLVIYFSQPAKSREEFGNWHKEMCEEICRRFSALPGIEIKHGKAQKLLNITFKQLYCFADAESKADHFKYCHIPIDNNIITWCENNAGITPPPTAWSFMSYSDYSKFEDSLYSWLNSKDNTKYRTADGIPCSPLQLDFIAWISKSDTRKGVVMAWQNIIKTSELWNKYKETALSVFPELGE